MARTDGLVCKECGAQGQECESRFHECLALEYEDPAYGQVHHLTVSAYMLQHSSKLTREGWLQERELLRDFLINGKPSQQVRVERSGLVQNIRRSLKIKSRDGRPVIAGVQWSTNIMGIRLDQPESYCQDVMAWAQSTLADSERIDTMDSRSQ